MSLRDEILADSPSAYLRFEETTGQHLDETANGNDSTTVTVTGQGTADPGAGHAGSGLGDDFDGTDDVVVVPYSTDFFPGAGSLPFTIFMVGKLDVIDTVFRRLLSWEDGTNGWNLHTQSGTNRKLTFERLGSGVTSVCGWNSAVIDTVYMIHAVMTGSALNLYVNGSLVVGPITSTQTMADPGVALNIGRRVSDASRFFNGQSYEFAFFKTALSTTRITAHWDARDDAGGASPVAIALTPASMSTSAGALTVAPGALATALTPASLALTASALTVVREATDVALTPAALSLDSQPLTLSLGALSTPLIPATTSVSAQVLTVVAAGAGVEIALTPAGLSSSAQALALALQAAQIPLVPASVTVTPQGLVVAVAIQIGLTPAGLSLIASGLPPTVTGVTVVIVLTPASVVVEAIMPGTVQLNDIRSRRPLMRTRSVRRARSKGAHIAPPWR